MIKSVCWSQVSQWFWSDPVQSHSWCFLCNTTPLFVGGIATLLPSGVCTKKWNGSLATNTTWLIIVFTHSILICGIHLVPLSRYPTRYISHPFSTYDDMFVLYQSTLCSLHLCIANALSFLAQWCWPGIHWYYPSSLICLCCYCYHQYPLLCAVF